MTRRSIAALGLAACSGLAHAEPVAVPADWPLPPPGTARSESLGF